MCQRPSDNYKNVTIKCKIPPVVSYCFDWMLKINPEKDTVRKLVI